MKNKAPIVIHERAYTNLTFKDSSSSTQRRSIDSQQQATTSTCRSEINGFDKKKWREFFNQYIISIISIFVQKMVSFTQKIQCNARWGVESPYYEWSTTGRLFNFSKRSFAGCSLGSSTQKQMARSISTILKIFSVDHRRSSLKYFWNSGVPVVGRDPSKSISPGHRQVVTFSSSLFFFFFFFDSTSE
jgi:hypothetical protein